MCNAYTLRHNQYELFDLASRMQIPVRALEPFEPRWRIGIKQRGLILKPDTSGELDWSWARWSLVPTGPDVKYPLNNARTDKLGSWPWKPFQSRRCLVPASGFWEPEKKAREKGNVPWSYYALRSEEPFLMAGLWSDVPDSKTGAALESYTVLIGDANEAMRVHDRMPVMLRGRAARTWIEPGPLPFKVLVPYPATEMIAWRVIDDAKNSRITPTPAMASPVEETSETTLF
ncbi:SOS response-associated peptidase [Marinivivus vitaminiproducens]|uniref:SOS response-associated peptidase n=1 Tax=Marinivivus vitaminiproducens TaxID=3035935 RepID=UPI0027A2AD94|nr:SOS response-associated peptidase family protein [Geminicoccaceae bacterium SCSIO 64248]